MDGINVVPALSNIFRACATTEALFAEFFPKGRVFVEDEGVGMDASHVREEPAPGFKKFLEVHARFDTRANKVQVAVCATIGIADLVAFPHSVVKHLCDLVKNVLVETVRCIGVTHEEIEKIEVVEGLVIFHIVAPKGKLLLKESTEATWESVHLWVEL